MRLSPHVWSAVACVCAAAACESQSVPIPRIGARGDTSALAEEAPVAAAAPPTTAAPESTPAAVPPAPTGPLPSPPPTAPPEDDPGPPPAGCAVTRDGEGFFRRTTPEGTYVGYVPASYTGAPMRLFVGLHGCGDDAYNFATWGVAPYDTRAAQDWIGISVEDRLGPGRCWSQSEDDVVLAAIEDISRCFWVHRQKIVLGGFSSGGELAYGLGLRQASRFAGLLIECSTASEAGDVEALAQAAAWKLPVAHVAHVGDSVFPIATVRADWTKLTARGIPVATREVAGGHDGTAGDWAGWLLPRMKTWRTP